MNWNPGLPDNYLLRNQTSETMNALTHRRASTRGRKSAFTLIELMVVILIIAILAALIVPRVVGRTGQAKVAAAKSDISTLSSMLDHFRVDCDRYPTTEEGLNALVTCPSGLDGKWHGPYTQKSTIPLDPWQNAYHYESPGKTGSDSYLITSYGSDGAPGGDGEATDITSDDQ